MPEDNQDRQDRTKTLNSVQLRATIIWASILASLGVYVGVAIFLKDQLPFIPLEPPVLSTVRLGLILATAIVLAIAPSVYRKTLATAYGRSGASEREILLLATNTYITALVIVMAMYESIGIFAMLLAFMGAGDNSFIGFMGVSAVAMLTARPKTAALMEHYSKTGNP
ncbi:MAG TPA: hypothetical protein ENI12_00525 [Nitrospirae bacterium]|nr:hypothetical protein [Nitrospirota bacterium]